MSVFEKLSAAFENRDADAYNNLMADDCVFVRHQTGTTMNKAEIGEMLKRMMGSGGTMGSRRCIYENDDILVVHSENDYPDGTREAVLAAYGGTMFEGGKPVAFYNIAGGSFGFQAGAQEFSQAYFFNTASKNSTALASPD